MGVAREPWNKLVACSEAPLDLSFKNEKVNFSTVNGLGKCVFHQYKVIKDRIGKVFGAKSFYNARNMSLKFVLRKCKSAVANFVNNERRTESFLKILT